ncbi:MAG: protein TolQ [Myxococcaceae bacterium]|nr:protein TolQ [Myxococcaceae bacterium]
MHHVIYGFLVTFQHQSPGGAAHMPSSYDLIAQATLPVKLVVALLLIFSLACWYIIGYKWLYLRRAFAENEAFLQIFEQTRQLNVAAEAATARPRSPIAAMFRAGYDELLRVKAAHEGDDAPGIENVERALRRAFSRQTTVLESMVPFLATTGSTAPFIGLFGTVYGIMHAFMQLSASRDTATIDRVGPGIAEALFTTAVGLVAAIPAVIAYNYFVRRLRVISTEMDIFGNDFLNIVRRHILK